MTAISWWTKGSGYKIKVALHVSPEEMTSESLHDVTPELNTFHGVCHYIHAGHNHLQYGEVIGYRIAENF